MKEFVFDWQIAGAFGFGLLIGWYVYYVNRYRKGDIQFGDILTLLGAIGGTAVLALFERATDLFGAYGVGLAVGFFAYFIVLLILVRTSPNFDADWFLDGRRKDPAPGWGYGADARSTVSPMAINPDAGAQGGGRALVNFYGVNPGDAGNALRALDGNALRLAGGRDELSAPNPDALRIEETCKAVWGESGPQGPYKNACNFYVIEVAHRLGFSLSGVADQLIDKIQASPWQRLADGPAARAAAQQGKLVIAGVKSAVYDPPRTEGHVTIVTPGDMNPAGWAPAGYWGSTDPTIRDLGGSGLPISRCFTAAVKDRIVYACRDL